MCPVSPTASCVAARYTAVDPLGGPAAAVVTEALPVDLRDDVATPFLAERRVRGGGGTGTSAPSGTIVIGSMIVRCGGVSRTILFGCHRLDEFTAFTTKQNKGLVNAVNPYSRRSAGQHMNPEPPAEALHPPQPWVMDLGGRLHIVAPTTPSGHLVLPIVTDAMWLFLHGRQHLCPQLEAGHLWCLAWMCAYHRRHGATYECGHTPNTPQPHMDLLLMHACMDAQEAFGQ